MDPILIAKVDTVPGLEGKAHWFLLAGVNSWEGLGLLPGYQWRDRLQRFPQKRGADHPEDLLDVSRLGPGHMNSLDGLYRDAVQSIKGGRPEQMRALRAERRGIAADLSLHSLEERADSADDAGDEAGVE